MRHRRALRFDLLTKWNALLDFVFIDVFNDCCKRFLIGILRILYGKVSIKFLQFSGLHIYGQLYSKFHFLDWRMKKCGLLLTLIRKDEAWNTFNDILLLYLGDQSSLNSSTEYIFELQVLRIWNYSNFWCCKTTKTGFVPAIPFLLITKHA